MKRISAAFVAILVISVSLAGQVPASGPAGGEARATNPETESAASLPGFYNTTVGILIGTHKSPDSRFGEVFGDKTSLQFGLDLSRTLFYLKGFEVDVSFEARSITKTGQATLSGDETKLSMVPLTVAGLLLYPTKYVIPFVGAGGDWYHYSEKSVLANTAGWASGYHYQGGLFIVIPGLEALRVKVYYKYTKVSETANDITVKLGGPEYGIGVNYGFNFLNEAALVVR